jgi:XRE family aerobic/anaerobic benzoate catabolism transcriptional regulator
MLKPTERGAHSASVRCHHTPRTQPEGRRDSEAFLIGLGERVRAERKAQGLSRRVLSGISGVSERYLAQLETGSGNVSIVLLRDIAMSLGVTLENLVCEQRPMQEDLAGRSQRIALVGLRGAGKSTLGFSLARSLDMPFIELNDEIERRSGLPVSEIFNLYGQDGYRRLEAEALDTIAAGHQRVVLAVAGGIVANADTYNLLLRDFHTIWLKASAEEHMNRVRAQGDLRPMEGNPAAMVQLRKLLDERNADYARSHYSLNTSGSAADVAHDSLVELVRQQILAAQVRTI